MHQACKFVACVICDLCNMPSAIVNLFWENALYRRLLVCQQCTRCASHYVLFEAVAKLVPLQ